MNLPEPEFQINLNHRWQIVIPLRAMKLLGWNSTQINQKAYTSRFAIWCGTGWSTDKIKDFETKADARAEWELIRSGAKQALSFPEL